MQNTVNLSSPYSGSSQASVTVNCPSPWIGETATGRGTKWTSAVKDAPSTWFMFTPYTTAKVDLIAGQFHDAGDISFTKSGKNNVTISFTLHAGYRLAAGAENVKVEPMSCKPGAYIQPGAFSYKYSVSTPAAGGGSFSVPGPIGPGPIPNASCYAIHVDVERLP